MPEASEPPHDPEDWTDEQWISWLAATDPEPASGEQPGPTTLGARVVHSSGGVVLGAAMSGLAEIFGQNQEPEVVVVAEVPEGTDDPEFVVTLDPDFPERSVVTVRSPQPLQPPEPPTATVSEADRPTT